MDSNVIPTIKHRDTIRAVYKSEFAPALTAQHCALIRLLRVTWLPIESGCPGIFWLPFGKHRPTLATAMAALKVEDETVAARLVAELGLLVAQYVRTGAQLAPGRYPVPADVAVEFSSPEYGIGPDGHFTFTAQRATVLKFTYWISVDASTIEDVLEEEDTEVWPMPFVDGKYPYGECGYYQIDMANALGEPYVLDESGHMIHDAAKDHRLENLHYETLVALQVFLTNATPKSPGEVHPDDAVRSADDISGNS